MKLCKDCMHSIGVMSDSMRCTAPQNMFRDPVTGSDVPLWTYCASHRTGEGTGFFWRYQLSLCGKGARWFEPKN